MKAKKPNMPSISPGSEFSDAQFHQVPGHNQYMGDFNASNIQYNNQQFHQVPAHNQYMGNFTATMMPNCPNGYQAPPTYSHLHNNDHHVHSQTSAGYVDPLHW